MDVKSELIDCFAEAFGDPFDEEEGNEKWE